MLVFTVERPGQWRLKEVGPPDPVDGHGNSLSSSILPRLAFASPATVFFQHRPLTPNVRIEHDDGRLFFRGPGHARPVITATRIAMAARLLN
jgi:hypothetical protein